MASCGHPEFTYYLRTPKNLFFFFDGENSPLLALREYIQFIKNMLFNLHSKNFKILFEILKHIII